MATIYVSGGGTALRTAVLNCADGDDIIVGDGTYTGSSVLLPNRKRFSVTSENGWKKCIVRFLFGHNGSDYAGDDIRVTGITFYNPPNSGNTHVRFNHCMLVHCVLRSITRDYHLFGNMVTLWSCLCCDSTATSGRLTRGSICVNCTFANNVIADGILNYGGSRFSNCLFAGNVAIAGGEPLTNYGSTSSNPNCMAGGSDLVDASSRPVAGSAAYGGGSSTYLETATDLAGTPWLDPPAIGCYEYRGGGYQGPPVRGLFPMGGRRT